MTDQEIFDAVWKGAKAQGFARSMRDEDLCVYRAPNGLKCYAGLLIPDEVYDPGIEGGDAVWAFGRLGLQVANIDLVFRLQVAHDNAFDEEDHEHNLRTIAQEQCLTIPEER